MINRILKKSENYKEQKQKIENYRVMVLFYTIFTKFGRNMMFYIRIYKQFNFYYEHGGNRTIDIWTNFCHSKNNVRKRIRIIEVEYLRFV